VQHTITHLKPRAAGFALAVLLLVPATAHAGPSSDREPVQNRASFGGSKTNAAGSSIRLGGVEDAVGRPANRRPSPPTTGSGLGWRDAAIGMSILIGIALFGLWGDVAVGIVVLVVDILIGAAATLGTRRPGAPDPTCAAPVRRAVALRRTGPP
jgi:hypothetical protein